MRYLLTQERQDLVLEQILVVNSLDPYSIIIHKKLTLTLTASTPKTETTNERKMVQSYSLNRDYLVFLFLHFFGTKLQDIALNSLTIALVSLLHAAKVGIWNRSRCLNKPLIRTI